MCREYTSIKLILFCNFALTKIDLKVYTIYIKMFQLELGDKHAIYNFAFPHKNR